MPRSRQPIKVLIVDDHAFLRAGLKHFLWQCPDLQVVGEAATGREALAVIAKDRPGLVILDWLLPDASGWTLIPRIKRRWPAVKVLVFTAHDEEKVTLSALEAGADGFLCKEAPCETIVSAVRSVARGETWADPSVLDRFLRLGGKNRQGRDNGRSRLTERESEIARLVGDGRENREIAERLRLSEQTVKFHLKNIFQKLGFDSRLQLGLWVRENGSDAPRGKPISRDGAQDPEMPPDAFPEMPR